MANPFYKSQAWKNLKNHTLAKDLMEQKEINKQLIFAIETLGKRVDALSKTLEEFAATSSKLFESQNKLNKLYQEQLKLLSADDGK